MFKFLLACCIISLSESVPGKVGVYSGLVLVQRWLKTSIAWENRHRNSSYGTSGEPSYEYEWIIHGLWPLSIDNDIYTYGKTYNGASVTYNGGDLNRVFKTSLRFKWPTTSAGDSVENCWRSAYDEYGSCISSYTKHYFETAVSLLDNNNVGQILVLDGINPGGTYSYNHIVSVLKDKFQTKFYVKCIPAEDDKQYLAEVHVCFTPGRSLRDCNHLPETSDINNCHRNKDVIYELA